MTGVLTGVLTDVSDGCSDRCSDKCSDRECPRTLEESASYTTPPHMKVRPWLLCPAPLVPAPGLPLSRVLTPLPPGRGLSGVAPQGFLHHGP